MVSSPSLPPIISYHFIPFNLLVQLVSEMTQSLSFRKLCLASTFLLLRRFTKCPFFPVFHIFIELPTISLVDAVFRRLSSPHLRPSLSPTPHPLSLLMLSISIIASIHVIVWLYISWCLSLSFSDLSLSLLYLAQYPFSAPLPSFHNQHSFFLLRFFFFFASRDYFFFSSTSFDVAYLISNFHPVS